MRNMFEQQIPPTLEPTIKTGEIYVPEKDGAPAEIRKNDGTTEIIDPERNNRESSNYIEPSKNTSQKPKINLGRRNFVKKIGTTAALGAVASTGTVSMLHPFGEDEPKEVSKEKLNEDLEPTPEVEFQYSSTKEQESITKDDNDVIGKTFHEQLKEGKITLNEATKHAIYTHWRDRYGFENKDQEGSLYSSLEKGLTQMQPWVQEIRTVFQEEGVPEELVYLSIPESHFDIYAVAPSSLATGPYQFMNSQTSRNLGLRIEKTYDERFDPVKSARAAAKHLRESYENFGRDWTFALMDYNGGITNKYIQHIMTAEKTAEITVSSEHTVTPGENLSSIARHYETSLTLLMRANNMDEVSILGINDELNIPQKRIIDYDHFLAWMEEEINQEIEEIKNSADVYTVKKGDTLSEIAEQHDMTQGQLQELNDLPTTEVALKQQLEVISNEDVLYKKLNRTLAKYSENLNYPEKFFAVRDVIDQMDLRENFPSKPLSYETITPPKVVVDTRRIEIKYKDTLSSISLRIHDTMPRNLLRMYSPEKIVEIIKKENNIGPDNLIRIGQILTIPIPTTQVTLNSLALKYNISVENLHKINPAIAPPQYIKKDGRRIPKHGKHGVTLPKGISVRIPTIKTSLETLQSNPGIKEIASK